MSLVFEELITDNILRIVVSMVVAFGVTWSSIPVIRNLCMLRNLNENPKKRSSHTSPIPTFAGVAIFASTLIGYMLWNFGDEGFLMHKVFAGLVILFFLGIKDDLYELNPYKKIITEVLVAVIIVMGSDMRITNFFGVFGIHELPYLISVPFTIFLIVALINSFNLIDGVDGLSGGIAMIASGGFALWFALNDYWSLACLGFTLSASLLGFLRFNFSGSSKIFMGNTGSLILGLLVSVLAIKFVEVNVTNQNTDSVYKNAPVIALILLSVPIFDTLRVFGLRIMRGRSPFKADRMHLHHLMVDNGISHIKTSLIFYIYTVVSTAIFYASRKNFTNTQLAFTLLALFGVYLWVGYLFERRRLKHHKTKLIRKDDVVVDTPLVTPVTLQVDKKS